MYIVTALLKTGSYKALHGIFTSHYLRPKSERYSNNAFDDFGSFYGSSEALQSVLAPERHRLYSPAAELIKRQADRADLTFPALIEAELVILLSAFVTPDVVWFPQTLYYKSGNDFPFFVRATQHRHFEKLATITGISNADALREAVKAGYERLGVNQWPRLLHAHSFILGMHEYGQIRILLNEATLCPATTTENIASVKLRGI